MACHSSSSASRAMALTVLSRYVTSTSGSERMLWYQPGVRDWPKLVPMTAMSSPAGTPTNGAERSCPVRAPVVVTVRTGSPAKAPGRVTWPQLNRNRDLSTWSSVLAKNQAPARVAAICCIATWALLGLRTW